MEKTARSLVTAAPGVELRAGAVVTGLQFEGVRSGDAGAPRVTGVQLADGTTLAADLVVDASGRSSKAADWMAAAGLQRPDELILDAKLGYATRQYKIPTTGYTGRRAVSWGCCHRRSSDGWGAATWPPAPPRPRPSRTPLCSCSWGRGPGASVVP